MAKWIYYRASSGQPSFRDEVFALDREAQGYVVDLILRDKQDELLPSERMTLDGDLEALCGGAVISWYCVIYHGTEAQNGQVRLGLCVAQASHRKISDKLVQDARFRLQDWRRRAQHDT